MSKLKEYRGKHGVSQAEFADMVGALQSTISKIEGGTQVPGLELAVKISRVTNGAVRPDDWIDDCDVVPTGEAAA